MTSVCACVQADVELLTRTMETDRTIQTKGETKEEAKQQQKTCQHHHPRPPHSKSTYGYGRSLVHCEAMRSETETEHESNLGERVSRVRLE
jgi:hypothetical protein